MSSEKNTYKIGLNMYKLNIRYISNLFMLMIMQKIIKPL